MVAKMLFCQECCFMKKGIELRLHKCPECGAVNWRAATGEEVAEYGAAEDLKRFWNMYEEGMF